MHVENPIDHHSAICSSWRMSWSKYLPQKILTSTVSSVPFPQMSSPNTLRISLKLWTSWHELSIKRLLWETWSQILVHIQNILPLKRTIIIHTTLIIWKTSTFRRPPRCTTPLQSSTLRRAWKCTKPTVICSKTQNFSALQKASLQKRKNAEEETQTQNSNYHDMCWKQNSVQNSSNYHEPEWGLNPVTCSMET